MNHINANSENGKLVYLPIDKLNPHPDNPRKALGDLEELTDSIKKNGVLQNLTVVPYFSSVHQRVMNGLYTVIIGHRRLAAAKQAGLTELPCIVADMTPQEQVSTMLVENMQRSDLTVYEQAQGFQMMLDFGDSIESIAEKSGFSQSTIRRRVKLLELDQDQFRQAESRGASLADYLELDKIKDTERKNRVLKSIGTENFKYTLKSAIEEEKREERIEKICEVLDTFAVRVESQTGYRYVTSINNYAAANDILKPEDADEKEYFYYVTNWHSIYLLEKEEDREGSDGDLEEQRAEAERVRQEREGRRAGLDELRRRAYELRKEFAEGLSTAIIKKNFSDIIGFWLWHEWDDQGGFLEEEEIVEILGADLIVENEVETLRYEDAIKAAANGPERMVWRWICSSLDSTVEGYFYYSLEHRKNAFLDRYYDLLEKLGYQISDEEKQMRDGSHRLLEVKQ